MCVPQLCKLCDHAHLSICCILSQNSIVWMTMCAVVVHVLHSSFRLSIVFMIAIASAPLSMHPQCGNFSSAFSTVKNSL